MSPSKPAANAPTAFLGLGSNLGDRFGLLAQAVERLNGERGIRVEKVSSIYATVPVGLAGQPEFLNAVAQIRTEQEPEDLLEVCLRIERDLGRVRLERWGPRAIDIDLLLYADRRSAGERLQLPHPRMKERAFVLIPLAEIAPGLVLEGRTIADWASRVEGAGVRRLDQP